MEVPDPRNQNFRQETADVIEQFQEKFGINDPSEMFVIVMVNHDSDYSNYK